MKSKQCEGVNATDATFTAIVCAGLLLVVWALCHKFPQPPADENEAEISASEPEWLRWNTKRN